MAKKKEKSLEENSISELSKMLHNCAKMYEFGTEIGDPTVKTVKEQMFRILRLLNVKMLGE